MKVCHRLLLALFLLQAYVGIGQVNKPELGIKMGVNEPDLSAPDNNSTGNSVTRLHAGLFARIPLGGKMAFRPEIFYSGQGQRNDFYSSAVPGGSSIGSVTRSMNYLNVPMMLEWGRRISIHGGAQLGLLLAAKEAGTINNVAVNNDLTSGMPKKDFSLVGGVSYTLARRINIGLRYQHGLTNLVLQTGGIAWPTQSRVLQIFACFSF
ncbi:MAG TPA: hypothetical protein DDZ56_01965 [Cytophagales bacterium]|nr:hypothetical protein [Cytophagales bacterium]